MTLRPSAQAVIATVFDPGSFEEWKTSLPGPTDDITHRPDVPASAQTEKAVIVGRGLVHGRPVAAVVSDFRHLGGSIGAAAAERITRAVRRATNERIPLLAATASGGTRMQEGTPAFVQMMTIVGALMAHRSAGLPYLVYLRHPTTGGVLASWGSLGHITLAEPGALVGFLGPKVYEALEGRPFPSGIQTSEHLQEHGVVDTVVPLDHLRDLVERVLRILMDPPDPAPQLDRSSPVDHGNSAWTSVTRTRSSERAGVRDILEHGATGTVPLSGTGAGERSTAVMIALTRLAGQPCVVVGQDREAQLTGSPMGPEALRQAQRGMRLAQELGLPLVTFIDTPGAELSPRAEEGALAAEIARCLAAMTTMTVPTVAVLLGQGCGGGALALLAADHVIAAAHSWLAPLPPEGASAITHGDASHAASMAESQRIRAFDLLADRTAHSIVAEIDDDTPRSLALAVAVECGAVLHQLTSSKHLLTPTGALPLTAAEC